MHSIEYQLSSLRLVYSNSRLYIAKLLLSEYANVENCMQLGIW